MGSDVRKGIVSFDMDMTLLDHADWKIPDSAREALKSLKERYYVVIATGRDMPDTVQGLQSLWTRMQ